MPYNIHTHTPKHTHTTHTHVVGEGTHVSRSSSGATSVVTKRSLNQRAVSRSKTSGTARNRKKNSQKSAP